MCCLYSVCFAISPVYNPSSGPHTPNDLSLFIPPFFSHIILIMILELHYSISHLFFFLTLRFLNYEGGYSGGNHIHYFREFEIGGSEVKPVRLCVFMSDWIHRSNLLQLCFHHCVQQFYFFLLLLSLLLLL